MGELPEVQQRLAALAQSSFRRRIKLSAADAAYLRQKGLDEVLRHAREFVQSRLAVASPSKDGKQTPMRGHPAFVAQHATGTCCRSCLGKWHGIAPGRAMTKGEIDYVLTVLEAWLRPHLGVTQAGPDPPQGRQTYLF